MRAHAPVCSSVSVLGGGLLSLTTRPSWKKMVMTVWPGLKRATRQKVRQLQPAFQLDVYAHVLGSLSSTMLLYCAGPEDAQSEQAGEVPNPFYLKVRKKKGGEEFPIYNYVAQVRHFNKCFLH